MDTCSRSSKRTKSSDNPMIWPEDKGKYLEDGGSGGQVKTQESGEVMVDNHGTSKSSILPQQDQNEKRYQSEQMENDREMAEKMQYIEEQKVLRSD